jgi:hypothetical protein
MQKKALAEEEVVELELHLKPHSPFRGWKKLCQCVRGVERGAWRQVDRENCISSEHGFAHGFVGQQIITRKVSRHLSSERFFFCNKICRHVFLFTYVRSFPPKKKKSHFSEAFRLFTFRKLFSHQI